MPSDTPRSAMAPRWTVSAMLVCACGAAVYGAVLVTDGISYQHLPEVLAQGGAGGGLGVATNQIASDGVNYQLLASIGELAATSNSTTGATPVASSGNYRAETGFLHIENALTQAWVQVNSVLPSVIGPGAPAGTAAVTWTAAYTGTYTVTVVGSTWTGVSSSCTGGTQVVTNVPASALAAPDATNTIQIQVTATSPPGGTINPWVTTTTVVHDGTAPVHSAFNLTRLVGTVSDPNITQLTAVVPGQPPQNVTVTAGSFTFSYPSGATQITLQAAGYQDRVVYTVP